MNFQIFFTLKWSRKMGTDFSRSNTNFTLKFGIYILIEYSYRLTTALGFRKGSFPLSVFSLNFEVRYKKKMCRRFLSFLFLYFLQEILLEFYILFFEFEVYLIPEILQ